LTAYAVLSPEPNSSGLRRCRLDGSTDPVGSITPPAAWPSHGCQDHTVLPYASAPTSRAPDLAHRINLLCAPAPSRPPHPIPRSWRSRYAPLAGTRRAKL